MKCKADDKNIPVCAGIRIYMFLLTMGDYFLARPSFRPLAIAPRLSMAVAGAAYSSISIYRQSASLSLASCEQLLEPKPWDKICFVFNTVLFVVNAF